MIKRFITLVKALPKRVKLYAVILALGLVAGVLAKAATYVGLLGFDASTAAFLVVVLTGARQEVSDYAKKLLEG